MYISTTIVYTGREYKAIMDLYARFENNVFYLFMLYLMTL
jgi:hypothetical protein